MWKKKKLWRGMGGGRVTGASVYRAAPRHGGAACSFQHLNQHQPLKAWPRLHGNKPRLGARLISILHCKVKLTLENADQNLYRNKNTSCYTKHVVPSQARSDSLEERPGVTSAPVLHNGLGSSIAVITQAI